MKDIIDRFSWDSDVKVISNSIDIALKDKLKKYIQNSLKQQWKNITIVF